MDEHAALALLQDLNENDLDGGEEMDHDISDYPSDLVLNSFPYLGKTHIGQQVNECWIMWCGCLWNLTLARGKMSPWTISSLLLANKPGRHHEQRRWELPPLV